MINLLAQSASPMSQLPFMLLWIGGMLWAVHIRPALGRPGKRSSGLLLLGMSAVFS